MRHSFIQSTAVVFVLGELTLAAADWPQFGGNVTRNMVSDEKDLPGSFDAGDATNVSANIKWVAHLEGNCFGANNPCISGGKIFIALKSKEDGIPNHDPFRSFSCLDEASGKLLWQYNSCGANRKKWGGTVFSTTLPTVDGGRVYFYSQNLIVCLTTDGLGGENHGPFLDEKNEFGLADNQPPGKNYADIVWLYDVYEELNVKLDHCLAYAPLVYGNYLYTSSGNATIDFAPERKNIDNAKAPCFIAIDKNTGRLVARDKGDLLARQIRGQWGSPSVGMVNGRAQILFGAGNGKIFAFEPVPDNRTGEAVSDLKTIWSCDPQLSFAQPPLGGRGVVMATPVCHDNRVYCVLGQDYSTAKKTDRNGMLLCIDATQTGDISQTGVIWNFQEIGISVGTVSIADGLLYITDVQGKVYCLDEKTGNKLWVFDCKNPVYSSTLVADGKVYFGDSLGNFYILKAGKDLQVLCETKLLGVIAGPLAVANKVLYFTSGNSLYAIQKGAY